MLRDQIERYNQRLRDFEDKQRVYRSHQQLDRPGDTDIEVSLVSAIIIFLNSLLRQLFCAQREFFFECVLNRLLHYMMYKITVLILFIRRVKDFKKLHMFL
jgi:hypothetical protein